MTDRPNGSDRAWLRRLRRSQTSVGAETNAPLGTRGIQWPPPVAAGIPPPFDVKLGWRLLFYRRVVELTAGLAGDFVECGVGTGQTLLLWLTAFEDACVDRHCWGFDTFEGLPKLSSQDRSAFSSFAPGDLSVAKPRDVRELFQRAGYGEARFNNHVSLVPGLLPESLRAVGGDVALVHLDLDLYESYQGCLEALWPAVVPGGVIVLDEYLRGLENATFPGARLAVDSFLDSHDATLRRDDRYGKYFIVKAHAG